MTFRGLACGLLAAIAPIVATPAFARQTVPLAAQVTVREIPTFIEARAAATVLIEVRNRGTEVWRSQGSIRLAYHWLTPSGEIVVRDGERTLLPGDVRPGETVRLCATLLAPDEAGRYQVEWEMVLEGVRWFADNDPAERRRPVRVTPATGGPFPRASPALLIFFAVTIGHFLLTRLWLHRAGWTSGVTGDERLFAIVLTGLGSFIAVLHIVACTAGLSLAAVSGAVAVLHAGAAVLTLSRLRLVPMETAADEARPSETTPSSAGERIFEALGTIVLSALLMQWFAGATGSMAVVGTDAEHYHVPNAVNFALGANPLDFVATPHLYPMGTSLLAAWFILPLGDPLLVDFTLAPMFLLTFSALAVLFRQVTGASGLAWVPWFLLPLFATPLFQASSLMSADLPYAAAFLAVFAQLFRMWIQREVSFFNVVMAGFGFGLLLGSKTTGAVSAVLLLALYAVLLAVSRRGRVVTDARRGVAWLLAGTAIAIAAGGIWPIRNWINYGSPLAPSGLSVLGVTVFPGDTVEGGRYYLSVLKDVRDVPGYRVLDRAMFFTREWFGPWFLPLLLGLVPMLVEAVASIRRRYASDRLKLFAAVALLTVPHIALLVQAPWSSLEWTRGTALRYALPFFILWPFLSFLALFPVAWRWTSRFVPCVTIGTALAASALVFFAGHAAFPSLPPLEGPAIVRTGLAIALVAALRYGGRPSLPTRIAGPVFALLLVWMCAAQTAAADSSLRKIAVWARNAPQSCAGMSTLAPDRYTAAYATVLDYERRSSRTCRNRRFFVAGRFDAPMALQPPPFTNLVYDARPRTMVARAIAADGPGAQACDYVIASQAELQTDRGSPLVNRLRAAGGLVEIGPSGSYVIFSAARR